MPCMVVITYVVTTLVNLAKYTPTAPSVLECPDSVSRILDLKMIYRETNPVVFTKAAMLLIAVAQEKSLQKILLGTFKINDKLHSLLNLQERKLKLKTRQMIAKSKKQGMSMTRSQSMTPSKKKTGAELSALLGSWEIYKTRFRGPIEALKCLMGAFNIKC
ncbi:Abnormal spindle-like microcephaly-associated protein-like [Holothuria leucospilota]|uniref:Abnormal spindle-like microcephaly-associated protein-like n=1 Tax=Holothuria leucospilota TaxID=206669 RepID=A0A9Q0YIS8_HOLLE|nr:Abnormal spindle-like microcephaly-associated protein-like [Holothuria leucospilota]